MMPSGSTLGSAVLAVDTNVLVRLLVSDDLAQQRAVALRLQKAQAEGDSVLVTPVVLAEVAWVLDSAYGYGRSDIAAAIRRLVSTSPLVSPERADVLRALGWYAKGTADFADYLILALSKAHGARTLLTFDRRLLRHGSCERP